MTEDMVKKDGTNPWTLLFDTFPKMGKMFKEILKEDREVCRGIIRTLDGSGSNITAMIVTAQFGFVCPDILQHFQAPIIAVSPSGHYSRWTKFLGNPDNPSHMPGTFLPMLEPLSLKERLISSFIHFLLDYNLHIWFWEEWTRLGEYADIQYSKWAELMRTRVDLLLQATHHVTHGPSVLAPNTVEIGGIHCREGRPLPPHLQTILDSHPAGVLLVSFGSSIKPSQMTKEKMKVFLETFSQLNYTVIWKWDGEEMSDLPSNVILQTWVPQQDLLAHPHLKVFVTHGGLLSLQETLYHSTPIVGIPLGNDQKPNMMRAERNGYAIMLDWQTLNTKDLVAAIKRAATDQDMRESVERSHSLFVDQSETAQERAVWWIEYTVRHGGAQFLRPTSLALSWYQYHLIDVISVILTFSLLSCGLVLLCCLKLCKCIVTRPALKNKTD